MRAHDCLFRMCWSPAGHHATQTYHVCEQVLAMCPDFHPLVGEALEFYRKTLSKYMNEAELLVSFLCANSSDSPTASFGAVSEALHIHRECVFKDVPKVLFPFIGTMALCFTRGPLDENG